MLCAAHNDICIFIVVPNGTRLYLVNADLEYFGQRLIEKINK